MAIGGVGLQRVTSNPDVAPLQKARQRIPLNMAQRKHDHLEILPIQTNTSSLTYAGRGDKTMRFRVVSESDVDACFDLLKTDGRCMLSPEMAATAPGVLRMLSAINTDYRGHSSLWETHDEPGEGKMNAFGMGVFVHDWFMDGLLGKPRPYMSEAFYRCVREGRMPVLTNRELAVANAKSSLNLFILHYVQRVHEIFHPDNQPLVPLGPQAWTANYAGYNMRRIMWELYGQEGSSYLGGAGFKQVANFSAQTAHLAPDRQPNWNVMEQDGNAQLRAFNSLSLLVFNSPKPRLNLTPAQQRVLILSLQGETDKEIAERNNISLDAVKQTWEGVLDRVPMEVKSDRDKGSGAAAANGTSSKRGPERRRAILQYIRQHMEELRPYKASA